MTSLIDAFMADVAHGIYSGTEAEALAMAADFRQRDSLLWDLFIPVGGSGALVITEAVFRGLCSYISAKGPDMLQKMGKQFVKRQSLVPIAIAGSMTTGPGVTVSAPLFISAVEIYSLLSVAVSQGMDIVTLWRSYPSDTEASNLLPAALLTQEQAAAYLRGEGKLVNVDPDDVATAAAYVAHCSSNIPDEDTRKISVNFLLMVAWQTSLTVPALAPLIAKARKRLGPFMGSDTAARRSRMAEFTAVYAKYGGKKALRRANLGLKLWNYTAGITNIYIAANNLISSTCREIDCRYVKALAGGALDFIMEPSRYELQLPWKQTCPTDSICVRPAPSQLDPSTLDLIDQINLDRSILEPLSSANRAVGDIDEQATRAIQEYK